MAVLDFIVIGAQKSGTTTLWHLLREHPQLSLPASKEAPFFSDARSFEHGIAWFEETFFPARRPGELRGTVTPQYMLGWQELTVEDIAGRIHGALPAAKLIAILRDPVARAVSHHRMSALRGLDRRPLERALREQLAPASLAAGRRGATGPPPHSSRVQPTTRYITAGEYGRILGIYLGHFPQSQLLVLLTSDLERDPAGTLARTLAFLDVDDHWRPNDLDVRRFAGGEQHRLAPDQMQALARSLRAAAPQLPASVFDLALAEWNTIPGGAPTQPSAELEERLRAHFAADADVLQELCDLHVPWATPVSPSDRVAPTESPETSIVVLVHDTIDEATALLHSLVRHTEGAYEIVLVDNGSPSPACDQLAALAESHGARLVRLEENLVFARAVNIGLTEARGGEIALLNSDVIVTPNWLSNLRAALYCADDVAIVGPRTNYVRTKQGGIWLDDTSGDGIVRFGRFFNHPDPTRRFEIDWLSGYAMLFRRAAVLAVGGFDETVPWYGQEDRLICEALRSAGYRVMCAGDTFVYHAGHRTFLTTGTNRTATRLQREARPAPPRSGPGGRLLKDGPDLVFEVLDGIASHLETEDVVELVRWGRPIEAAAASELERLPVGPPVSACRLLGTDEVWVLRGRRRHRVTGDPQRMRRLQGLSMIDRGDLEGLLIGEDLAVEDAIGPIPDLRPRLDSNPARIEPDGLAGTAIVASEIRLALEAGRGYGLVRLGAQAVVVLNDGIWPVDDETEWRPGAGGDRSGAAAAVRRAIIDADAVTVVTDRERFTGAPLLEQVLFHHDLYPRLRCDGEIGPALLGVGSRDDRSLPRGPLGEMLEGRPVAVVCPAALVAAIEARARAHPQARSVLVPQIAVGLDDLSEIERALLELADRREAFDAVLLAAGLAGTVLAARLARELDVVALDVGEAFNRFLHPRYGVWTTALARTRWELQQYLRQASSPAPQPSHELDGRLVRAWGERQVFYVERGRARAIAHKSLFGLLGSAVMEVEPAALAALPSGAPVCVVHELLTGPYVLLDGRKVRVALGMEIVALEDFALEAVPTADSTLRWFPDA